MPAGPSKCAIIGRILDVGHAPMAEEQRPVRQRRVAANGELAREDHGVAQRQARGLRRRAVPAGSSEPPPRLPSAPRRLWRRRRRREQPLDDGLRVGQRSLKRRQRREARVDRREKTPAHCAASILDAAHALVVFETATSVDVS